MFSDRAGCDVYDDVRPKIFAHGHRRSRRLWCMGVVYVFGSWKTAVLLHDIDSPACRSIAAGQYWLMFGLMVNWIGDTGAYYVGRKFRKAQTGAACESRKDRGKVPPRRLLPGLFWA